MIVQLILVAIALSLDSFGIGMSYGIRKIKFSCISILIISLISLLISNVSLSLGKLISLFFSEKITNFISISILVLMGIFIIKKAFEEKDTEEEEKVIQKKDEKNKIFSMFVKSLGITINIIKSPSKCDLNNSSIIEAKEAVYLGIVLSIDCVGAGISIFQMSPVAIFFPFLIMIFQLAFLFVGVNLGKCFNLKFINETKLSVISGLILIIMGGLKIIF